MGGERDVGIYPTIALSDLFNAVCCWYAAHNAFDKRHLDGALGIGIVGLAASFGVLRFGCFPRQFGWLNEFFSVVGGLVGIPLIGIAFARHSWISSYHKGMLQILEIDSINVPAPFPSRIVLSLVVAASAALLFGSPGFIELYTTVICVLSMGCVIAATIGSNFFCVGVIGVSFFVLAGLVFGSDKHKCILRVRRVNYFHYLIGLSMVAFAEAM